MVLERIINPQTLEGRPGELFMLGLFWTVFSAGISLYLFPDFSSVLAITFIVMLTLPFVYRVLADEEHHYDEQGNEKTLLASHSKIFGCFLFLFLGILSGYLGWYVLAPPDVVSVLFEAQTSTISTINAASGAATVTSTFSRIFWHNMRILIVSILLAFFLGAGPVFVLSWNASVIAAAMGQLIRNEWALLASSGSSLLWSETVEAFVFPLYRYLLHGIPEMLAYIVAGFAGGIISVAVIRHHFDKKHVCRALGDACTLLALCVFLLLAAAIIEVKILASV